MGIFRRKKKSDLISVPYSANLSFGGPVTIKSIGCDDPNCGCHDTSVFTSSVLNELMEAVMPLTDQEKEVASMSNAEDICAISLDTAQRATALGYAAEIGNMVDEINATLSALCAELLGSADSEAPSSGISEPSTFPESPSHVFETLENDDRHSVLYAAYPPVRWEEYETDSQHIARVLLDGLPYTVLCRVSETDDEIHRAYTYLPDDFSFSLYHEIIEKRIDRFPLEQVER